VGRTSLRRLEPASHYGTESPALQGYPTAWPTVMIRTVGLTPCCHNHFRESLVYAFSPTTVPRISLRAVKIGSRGLGSWRDGLEGDLVTEAFQAIYEAALDGREMASTTK
jgi:hypothetical protein